MGNQLILCSTNTAVVYREVKLMSQLFAVYSLMITVVDVAKPKFNN